MKYGTSFTEYCHSFVALVNLWYISDPVISWAVGLPSIMIFIIQKNTLGHDTSLLISPYNVWCTVDTTAFFMNTVYTSSKSHAWLNHLEPTLTWGSIRFLKLDNKYLIILHVVNAHSLYLVKFAEQHWTEFYLLC